MEVPRVFITGIPSETDNRDLESFFRPYGPIRVLFIRNQHAFVEFRSTANAELAISELSTANFLGQRITLDTTPSAFYGDSCLIVRNLTPNIGWRELRDHMNRAGEVFFVSVNPDQGNEGRVYFTSQFGMMNAIELLQESELDGTRIRLIPSERESGIPGLSSGELGEQSNSSRSHSPSISRSPPNISPENSRSSSLQEQEVSSLSSRSHSSRIEQDLIGRSTPPMSDSSSRSRSSQNSSRAHNSESADGSSSISQSNSAHLLRNTSLISTHPRSHSPTRSSSSSRESPIRTTRSNNTEVSHEGQSTAASPPISMEVDLDDTRKKLLRSQRKSRPRNRSQSSTAIKKTRNNSPGTSRTDNAEAVRNESRTSSSSRLSRRRSRSHFESEENSDCLNQTKDSSSSQSCHPQTSDSSSVDAIIDELRLGSFSPSACHLEESRSESTSKTSPANMEILEGDSATSQDISNVDGDASRDEPRPTAPQDIAMASTSRFGFTSTSKQPDSYPPSERKPVKRGLPMSTLYGKRMKDDDNVSDNPSRCDVAPSTSADEVLQQNELRRSLPSCSTGSPSRFEDRTHSSKTIVPWFERENESSPRRRYRLNSLGLIQERIENRLRAQSETPEGASTSRIRYENDDILSLFKWRLVCRSEDKLVGYFRSRHINRVGSTNTISAPPSPSADTEENVNRPISPIPYTSARKAPKRSSSMPALSTKSKRSRCSEKKGCSESWSDSSSSSSSSLSNSFSFNNSL